MNENVGHYEFVKRTAGDLVEILDKPSSDLNIAIAAATGSTNANDVEAHRVQLLAEFSELRDRVVEEKPQPYVHYASRFSIVGVYQSVLSKVFAEIPQLQGYGTLNALWSSTPVEEIAWKVKSFFHEVNELEGAKTPVLHAFLKAWKDLKIAKAPYPTGTSAPIPFKDECSIALLADWGGDNPAARRIAEIVQHANPEMGIHLGDIYYGGVAEECAAFLRNWPMKADHSHATSTIPAGSSFALNGNHEMYSGGESFFNVVLPAFQQPQPFFCLENQHWRLIGLDTAYLGGRLKPNSPDDSMMAQWNWLINLLKTGPARANVFLSHHQPVSAHHDEFRDSRPLMRDIEELLSMDGIGTDAIFGWFFGHEHRCTVYEDRATPFNARLIGSGCIPHAIQQEVEPDAGCTPFKWVSQRGEDGTLTAISEYAQLQFMRENLFINYVDERGTSLGTERWNAKEGRFGGTPFVSDKTAFLK